MRMGDYELFHVVLRQWHAWSMYMPSLRDAIEVCNHTRLLVSADIH
jgi:hypothetical protein